MWLFHTLNQRLVGWVAGAPEKNQRVLEKTLRPFRFFTQKKATCWITAEWKGHSRIFCQKSKGSQNSYLLNACKQVQIWAVRNLIPIKSFGKHSLIFTWYDVCLHVPLKHHWTHWPQDISYKCNFLGNWVVHAWFTSIPKWAICLGLQASQLMLTQTSISMVAATRVKLFNGRGPLIDKPWEVFKLYWISFRKKGSHNRNITLSRQMAWQNIVNLLWHQV